MKTLKQTEKGLLLAGKLEMQLIIGLTFPKAVLTERKFNVARHFIRSSDVVYLKVDFHVVLVNIRHVLYLVVVVFSFVNSFFLHV